MNTVNQADQPAIQSSTSNKFSIIRLYKLFLYDTTIYKRSFFITNLVILGICLLPIMTRVIIGVGNDFENLRESFSFSGAIAPHISFFAFMFYAFYIMHNKSNGNRTPHYILLPSSTPEKYILFWIELLFLILYSIILVVVYLSIISPVANDVWSTLDSNLNALRILSSNFSIEINGNNTHQYYTSMIWGNLYALSIFSFSALKFRKYAVAMLMSILIIYGQILLWSVLVFTFKTHIGDPFTDISSKELVVIITKIFFFISSILFLWLGYRTFAKKPVR